MNHIKELLYKMADDLLIIGHRNSEWTGLGPILEEDIAFSSMAQDKIGQAQALYQLLHDLGEQEPDTVAFMRNANQFHNCQLVELPNGDYDFSLMRHYLFDVADQLRFESLTLSSYEPLAKVARKIKGEIKYHVYHAQVWLQKLSTANEIGKARMQQALNVTFPYALGMFEPSKFESELIAEGVFVGEENIKSIWLKHITEAIEKAGLKMPEEKDWIPVYGGRTGIHTDHLQPLLDEMSEVFKVDPTAEW